MLITYENKYILEQSAPYACKNSKNLTTNGIYFKKLNTGDNCRIDQNGIKDLHLTKLYVNIQFSVFN